MRHLVGLALLCGIWACGRDGVRTDRDDFIPGDAGEPGLTEPDLGSTDRPDRPSDRPDRPTDRPDRPIPDACDVGDEGCADEDVGPTDTDPGDTDPGDTGPGDTDPGDTDPGDLDGSEDVGPPLDAALDAGTDAGPPPECAVDGDCNFGEHCSPTTLSCVACWNDQHCLAGRVCDETGGNVCRNPCLGGVCLSGVCDAAENACVGCLSNQDCGGGEICDPSKKECVQCADDADCALQPGAPVCDLGSNTCVACRNDGDCAAGQVCDESVEACVSPTGRGLCEPCTSDADCGGPDDWCLALGGVFDRACGQDCRNAPCPSGYACVPARNNSGMQCRPEYASGLSGWTSTCLAVRNLGQACEYSQSELDPGCGYENVRDARCIAEPTGAGFCTYACTQPEDCPSGSSCSGNASTPGVCQ